jgi:hypothetical protein
MTDTDKWVRAYEREQEFWMVTLEREFRSRHGREPEDLELSRLAHEAGDIVMGAMMASIGNSELARG